MIFSEILNSFGENKGKDDSALMGMDKVTPLPTPHEFLTTPQPISKSEEVVVCEKGNGLFAGYVVDSYLLNLALKYHLGRKLNPSMDQLEVDFPNLLERLAGVIPKDKEQMINAIAKVMDHAIYPDSNHTWKVDHMGYNTFMLVDALSNKITQRQWVRMDITASQKAKLLSTALSSEVLSDLAHRASLELIMQCHAYSHTAIYALIQRATTAESYQKVRKEIGKYRESCPSLYAAAISLGKKSTWIIALPILEMYAMEKSIGESISNPSFDHIKLQAKKVRGKKVGLSQIVWQCDIDNSNCS